MAEREAVLISYDTKRKRFDSLYDRNKFYRGLFGYKQTVKENGKVYKYEKPGLLGTVPHIKVEDSVIIVAKSNEDLFTDYLETWEPKVEYRTFRVILDQDDYETIEEQVHPDPE